MAQQNGEQLFTPAPSYIFEEHTDSAFFVWWYHLTSPTTPDVQASHKVWTRFRHARSTSRMLLALLLLTLLSLPVDFLLPNFVVGTLVITVFPMLLIATSLNRLGQTTLAGVFLMALLEGVLLGNLFLSYEDGSGTYLTPFYWLILPLLVASLLLPLRWVFAVAVLNSLFTMFVLLLTLHVSVLLVFQPLLLQGCVALVAFLWQQETARATARAERAEAITRLEHDLATYGSIVAAQKQQLETELQHILDTHMRVANGDLTARVPFDETHTLWQLSGLLNTLLIRYQHAKHVEEEF